MCPIGVPAVAAERAGSANRGGEVRAPGPRADTDAVPEELQKWQAARWIAPTRWPSSTVAVLPSRPARCTSRSGVHRPTWSGADSLAGSVRSDTVPQVPEVDDQDREVAQHHRPPPDRVVDDQQNGGRGQIEDSERDRTPERQAMDYQGRPATTMDCSVIVRPARVSRGGRGRAATPRRRGHRPAGPRARPARPTVDHN